MDLKQRLENQLDDAMLHAIILRTDIENIQNGLAVMPCFSPVCSLKTLQGIASAYNDLTIAIACALAEIKDNERENKSMELKDTIDGMLSKDYKERFKAEYIQVKIRYYKLSEILRKDKENTLGFKLTNKDLLIEQYKIMHKYLVILEQRARAEGINLN